jgi:hypothetical protein
VFGLMKVHSYGSRKHLLVVPASVALAAVLSLSACSTSDAGGGSTSTTTAAPPTTAGETSSTPTTAVTPTSVPATSTMSHLTAVRVSNQGNGDRVSFQFDQGVPGYSVATTTSPIAGNDGNNTTVSGTVVYEVKFATASDVDLSDGLKTYYNGSKDIVPTDAKVVSEIKQVSDSEGALVWAIGVNSRAAVNVSTVSSPAQVVIDLG